MCWAEPKYYLIKGALLMGVVIIFSLVALLAAYGAFTALKNKNFLGVFFAVGTLAVFGWFAIMTVIESGFPTGTH
jgi:hypothetical protein